MPLSITLLLDVSRSVVGERLTHLLQAGDGLLAALRPNERASLGTITAGGATALRDAIHLALELQPRDRTRPLILIFTDGADTASWLTADAVVDSARRVGVVVHAVRVENDNFLDRLAEVAGGRTWSASSDRQLRELFTRALDEMRARYVVTYTPRGVSHPGWHALKVNVKAGGADVTARPGYFVSESSPPP
jgi:VWFA-related protein